MFVHKIDEEVSLKLLELQDAARVYALTDNSRAYLREWLSWVDTTTSIEDTKGFIQHCLDGYAQNKSITTAIIYKGEIVGTAGYNNIDWTNKAVSIGYWLSEDFQGLGIMTKVTKGLTDYALHDLKLNRVEIKAAGENIKSRSIPERLGFINEGRIRQAEWLYDRYVDHIVYGMLAEDWGEK